jgi:type II secretory pathway component PulF
MALYFYQALSKDGKKVSGYFDASSIQNVREQLVATGLFPTHIELSSGVSVPWYKRLFQRSVGLKDKIFFTKQLAVLLKSGIPLVQALELLTEQTTGGLQNIVIALRDNIKEGKSLAESMQKFPGTFDNIYIQLVKAGEASGRLEVILERLTDYLVRRAEITKRIRGALTYPLIQLVIILLVVTFLLYFVVPEIASLFKKQNMPLPLPTRILIAMSDFLLNYWLWLIIGLIAIGTAFYFWSRTPSGSYTLDKLKLKLPIVGYFSRIGAVVQFSRTLGMLTEGGVNLAESLTIVVNIIDNKVLAKTLNEAKENIIKQGKIAQYLKQTDLFPPLAIYLINTGEQSGQLDTMLLTVARQYESELEEYADNLTTLLGPIMTVVMAMIVGFVVVSILSAISQMGDIASKMAERTEGT